MSWTSFKRSPVLWGHFFLSQIWPLDTGLTVTTTNFGSNSCMPLLTRRLNCVRLWVVMGFYQIKWQYMINIAAAVTTTPTTTTMKAPPCDDQVVDCWETSFQNIICRKPEAQYFCRKSCNLCCKYALNENLRYLLLRHGLLWVIMECPVQGNIVPNIPTIYPYPSLSQ